MIKISLTAPLSIPSHRYANRERQTSCIQCPGGSASEEGAFECGKCFAGTIESGGGVCTNCPSGQYSVAKSSECLPCEKGKSSLPGQPKCSACEPGTFRKGEPNEALGGAAVATAENNETNKTNGTANETAVTTTATEETASNCTSCMAGRYSAAQASECTLCKAGQYLGTVEGIACKLCQKGTYLDAEGQTRESHCKRCAVGRFNPIRGAGQATACQACSAGRYGSKQGAVGPEACKLCLAGRVGAEKGMASSKCSGECGPGNFSKSGESECRVCGISEYSTGGNEACTICGEYETTAIKGASKCVCQTGFFANPSTGGGGTAVADEKLVCTKCPVGFECDRPGVVVASAKLESGFWRSDNASLRALPCPSRDSCNSSAVNGTGGCVLGNEGPFCSLCSKNFTRFSEAADCKPCPSGEDEGSAVAALIAIIAGCLAAVVLYALFNHVIPKGVLKPFINGMQYLTIVMTTSTAKRPEIVDSMLKTLSVFSFDFDVMSLSCMGVDYDYGTKLVGMVTLVAGLMLCPLLHLLRLRSKALRREPESWFNKLATLAVVR